MVQAWTACASTHHSLELRSPTRPAGTRDPNWPEILWTPVSRRRWASSRVRPCWNIRLINGIWSSALPIATEHAKAYQGRWPFFLYRGTKETDAEVGGSHFRAACSSSRKTRFSRWRTVSSSKATVRTRGPRAILHIVDIGAHQVEEVGHYFEAGINFVVDPAPMR